MVGPIANTVPNVISPGTHSTQHLVCIYWPGKYFFSIPIYMHHHCCLVSPGSDDSNISSSCLRPMPTCLLSSAISPVPFWCMTCELCQFVMTYAKVYCQFMYLSHWGPVTVSKPVLDHRPHFEYHWSSSPGS